MTDRKVHLLLVEDNRADAELFREILREGWDTSISCTDVPSIQDAEIALEGGAYDLVLLDLGLVESSGLETLEIALAHKWTLPIIVLTALDDFGMGIEAVQAGAQDYLVKQDMRSTVVLRAIRYALERHRLVTRLRASREQLRRLVARIEDVRERDRTRISREIHDQLGQRLTSLKIDLLWLRNHIVVPLDQIAADLIQRRLMGAEQLLDLTLDEVKRIAVEMRPSALDQLGLVDAIRDEVRRFSERSSLPVELDLPERAPNLSPEVSTACFRILQELLTNVLRHANAHKVRIGFALDESEIRLDVQDDGVGMSLALNTTEPTLGLLGMSERAAAFGGTVDVNNATGSGTLAKVRIPRAMA